MTKPGGKARLIVQAGQIDAVRRVYMIDSRGFTG